MLSEREARYLKIVYKLEKEGWRLVGVQQVAEIVGVSRATAYEVLIRLVEKKLLVHFPKKGFALSEKGKCVVMRLIRVHRIIETMLVKLFNIPLEEACKCAAKLELVFPLETANKIFGAIGEPKCCPHGEPIPSLEECGEVISNSC